MVNLKGPPRWNTKKLLPRYLAGIIKPRLRIYVRLADSVTVWRYDDSGVGAGRKLVNWAKAREWEMLIKSFNPLRSFPACPNSWVCSPRPCSNYPLTRTPDTPELLATSRLASYPLIPKSQPFSSAPTHNSPHEEEAWRMTTVLLHCQLIFFFFFLESLSGLTHVKLSRLRFPLFLSHNW